LGGAGNVVANITSLGCKCDFLGVIGNDAEGRKISSLLKKIGVILVVGDVKLVPIVKSCALQLFVVYSTSHRLDNVKRCTCGSACPRDISGILRYFRLMQNYVNFSHSKIDPLFSLIVYYNTQ